MGHRGPEGNPRIHTEKCIKYVTKTKAIQNDAQKLLWKPLGARRVAKGQRATPEIQGASAMDFHSDNGANYMSKNCVVTIFMCTNSALIQLRKLRCLAQVTDEALLVDNPFLVDEASLVLVDESRRCLVT